MKRKQGYSLVEGLAAMLIISLISVAAIRFVSGSYKNAHGRDQQMRVSIKNMTVVEKAKGIKTLAELYHFSLANDVKIIEVGVGEVDFVSETAYNISIADTFGHYSGLRTFKLFRVETGGQTPNTRLITIIRLEGDGI